MHCCHITLILYITDTFVDTPSSLALMPGQEEATQSMMFFLQGSNYILVIAAETTVGLGTPSDGHVINLIGGCGYNCHSVTEMIWRF